MTVAARAPWPSGLDLPEETVAVIEGLRSFIAAEVEPRFRKLES